MQGNRQIRRLARTVASAAAGATLLAGVMVAATPTEASGGLPAGTLGQYVGFDEGGRFARAESDLGRPLDWVVTMADPGSPSAMRSSVWGQFTKSSAYLPSLSNRLDVTVSIPLAFGKAGLYRSVGPSAVRQALSKTTSGVYDDDYRVVARQLIEAGYGDAVLRLGHEFDGTWQPWSARDNEDAYIAAFRHVRNLFERESQAFRYEWTGMHGPWRWHAPEAYPGDAYVDIIGLDVYYRSQGTLDDTRWRREFEAALVAHRDFAIARGKPVSYPEWGRARDDTSRFIDLMYDWFDNLPNGGPGSLAYQAYFNPPGQGGEYDINNYPVVKKRYLQLFRTTSSASLPAIPATPTTTAPPKTVTPTTTSTLKPAERLAATTTVESLPAGPTTAAAAPVSPTSDVRDIWSQKLPTIQGTLVDGTLSLSWYHPDADRYIAKYRPVGTRWWKWTKQGSDTSLTATGLRENTAYEVMVKMHDVPNWYAWREAVIEPNGTATVAAALTAGPEPTAMSTTTTASTNTESTNTESANTESANTESANTESNSPMVTDDREIWSQKLPTVVGKLVDGTLSLSWYHPDAERYIARYRAVGTRWWTWTSQGPSTSLTATGLREKTPYQVMVRMHDVPNWYPWREVIIDPS